MHNSQFSYLFLSLLVAYGLPLNAMGPAAHREDVPGALPNDRSFVEKYRQNPLDSNFAQHVISTAPEGVIRLINRSNRGGDRMNHSLFNGPLGIGKSILARAVATQTGRSCFFLNLSSISSGRRNSEIVALRSFFEGIFRLEEPAVIVLDEITDESNQLDRLIGEKGVACLCAYADKVEENPQVSLIATTNNQEKFPNKIRNRFQTMEIDLPSQEKRQTVLTYLLHDAGLELDNTVIAWAAKKTSGLTYRDLQRIISQTYKNQYRDDAPLLNECFVQAVNDNAISIWSYFNPNAYTKKQSLMIKCGSEVMLSLAGIAFFAYTVAKMDMNSIHG